jgi:hypothetical protein
MKGFPIKRYLLLWALVLIGSYWLGYNSTYMCWDGLEVDEELLMELCGVTEEEYWTMDVEACPRSIEAVTMIGGCEPDWSTVIGLMVGVSVLYHLIFLGLLWLRRSSGGERG